MVPPLSALSLALCHKHKPLSSNTIFPSYVHQPTVRYEPKGCSLPMHILLEEAPLLVFHFLTLFLSNYKLRLILSIFWTTSTFCQLELPCSLRSLRSLDAHLLTHFVRSLRSLIAHSLRSFAQRSLHSLTSFATFAQRSLHSLTSFVRLLLIIPSISLATYKFAFCFAQYNS